MQEQMKLYKLVCNKLKDIDGLALEELNNYNNFKDFFTEDEFRNIIKTKQNRKNKRYRTKKKFLEILRINMCYKVPNKKLIFGTITLNDHYLNLKENTYIRQIHSWLKEHFIYSILNKDYGSKTEREHYHFIGLTDEDIEPKFDKKGVQLKSKKGLPIYELVNKNYKMGYEPTLCLVNLDINDIEKTIEYLLKLNNHSNKLGTKSRVRIIKNTKADMIILCNNLEPEKVRSKVKKSFYEKLKNTSYDTLNKRSVSNKVSNKDYKELSDYEFINFLDNNISYNEL